MIMDDKGVTGRDILIGAVAFTIMTIIIMILIHNYGIPHPAF